MKKWMGLQIMLAIYWLVWNEHQLTAFWTKAQFYKTFLFVVYGFS
jgi:hypothetical protein